MEEIGVTICKGGLNWLPRMPLIDIRPPPVPELEKGLIPMTEELDWLWFCCVLLMEIDGRKLVRLLVLLRPAAKPIMEDAALLVAGEDELGHPTKD